MQVITPTVITPPAITPVSLDTVKNFARITVTTDDDLITGFIAAATEQAEFFTKRMFINRTLLYSLDHFPGFRLRDMWWDGVMQGAIGSLQCQEPIRLPCTPLQSVLGIVVYDEFDNETTVDPTTYRLDSAGRIILLDGQSWPTGLRLSDAVGITVTAGYGSDPSTLPQSVCNAIMMQAQVMYDSRTACSLCDGSKALLAPLQVKRL